MSRKEIKMDEVVGLVIGVIIGCGLMAAVIHSVDIPADDMTKAIDICDSLGGLKYYDAGGDYTCGNGLVIELDGYEEKADEPK